MNRRRSRRERARTWLVPLPSATRPGSRLSEGTVLRAAIRARLLGIPLLHVDASAVLLPTSVAASSSERVPLARGSVVDAAESLNEASDILAQVQSDGRR